MENRKQTIFQGIVLILSACLMYAVSAGIRTVYGVMLGAISEGTGIAYGLVSFSIAIGQLVFGVTQPLFGVVAIKSSKRLVLALGSLLIALGLGITPFCTQPWMLIGSLGVVLATGTGAVSFGLIMGAITPKLGEAKAVMASSMVNASSGVGSIVLSPLLQKCFAALGLKTTMLGFALVVLLLLVPISMIVSGREEREELVKKQAVVPLVKTAFRNKSYLFLLVGFFTCGFHMAIIDTHLYSQIISYGIDESVTAIAFSVYGFTTVLGSLVCGVLCNRLPMKYVLGTLFGSRAVLVVLFFLLPKTIYTIFGFLILLGLTGAATMTPTSGLVGKLFGSENLATLFGLVFLSHQIGSFFSSWFGGKCVEVTGTYTMIWVAAMILSLIAMIASYSIAEKEN